MKGFLINKLLKKHSKNRRSKKQVSNAENISPEIDFYKMTCVTFMFDYPNTYLKIEKLFEDYLRSIRKYLYLKDRRRKVKILKHKILEMVVHKFREFIRQGIGYDNLRMFEEHLNHNFNSRTSQGLVFKPFFKETFEILDLIFLLSGTDDEELCNKLREFGIDPDYHPSGKKVSEKYGRIYSLAHLFLKNLQKKYGEKSREANLKNAFREALKYEDPAVSEKEVTKVVVNVTGHVAYVSKKLMQLRAS